MYAYFVSFALGHGTQTFNSGTYSIDSPSINSEQDVYKLVQAIFDKEKYRSESVTVMYFQRLPGNDSANSTRPA